MRVTSEVHPLFGHLLRATGFRRYQQVLYLVVVLPDGSPGTIPVASTDVLGEEPPREASTVLSVEGVRLLHALVDSLIQPIRVPSRPKTRK